MGRAFEFRKARKMKRWSAMAKTFTRIGKDIVIAVKEGGPNPETNSRLRAVIQNAKAANMPKDNVERAIKKATDKETANYKEVLFEGYAPHGIAVLVETATDNNNRTVANVRAAFNKYNGTLGTSGSVVFMFDHTCNFRVKAEDLKMDLEEFELELIDFDVEEVFEDEDGILIYAPFEQFGAIQKYLEENELEILSSGFERIPNTTKQLEGDDHLEVEKLLEKLEEDDDVQNVYHSMGIKRIINRCISINKMNQKTYSLDQLPEAAAFIVSNAKFKIVLFNGDMGSGKTTLIKEICRKLGVVELTNSPTFSLVNEYLTASGESLFHFDFYRINNEEEAYDIGIEEYLYSGNWCFIEWPEKVENLLPLDTVVIQLTINRDNTRTIQIN